MKKQDINKFGKMSRREFLAASGSAGLVFFTGCAVNPVTGKQQLMLLSRENEIALDRQHSPHQLSSDYGVVKDKVAADYLSGFGKHMAAHTHRKDMPYNFNMVNATYVNAYAFPGGTIAATRAIMLKLDNEAELAALMGHELGHVNARHAAESYTDQVVSSVVFAGVNTYAESQGKGYAMLTQLTGQIAQGALLSHYSRDNEREADELGMEYAVRSGYTPKGMIGLQKMLLDSHQQEPSILERMFATHPMSRERYETAKNRALNKYPGDLDKATNRERYMDGIAGIRAVEGAIVEMQEGSKSMAEKDYRNAESHYKSALKIAPDDYAGLLMYAECQKAMGKPDHAQRLVQRAQNINPDEPGSYNALGLIALEKGRYGEAFNAFQTYDKLLPGNPSISFYQGLTLEKMGRRRQAASYYAGFLKGVKRGNEAKHAFARLNDWGYIK